MSLSDLIQKSGLLKLLGKESSDVEIRDFFIETVEDALRGARTTNDREVTLLGEVVKGFLSDYDIEVSDEKQLKVICKKLLEDKKTVEEASKQSKGGNKQQQSKDQQQVFSLIIIMCAFYPLKHANKANATQDSPARIF